MQVEGNKLQSQQISGYNIMMSNITNKNEPSVLQHSVKIQLHNFIKNNFYKFLKLSNILLNYTII